MPNKNINPHFFVIKSAYFAFTFTIILGKTNNNFSKIWFFKNEVEGMSIKILVNKTNKSKIVKQTKNTKF